MWTCPFLIFNEPIRSEKCEGEEVLYILEMGECVAQKKAIADRDDNVVIKIIWRLINYAEMTFFDCMFGTKKEKKIYHA